jgi:hypothetical protein
MALVLARGVERVKTEQGAGPAHEASSQAESFPCVSHANFDGLRDSNCVYVVVYSSHRVAVIKQRNTRSRSQRKAVTVCVCVLCNRHWFNGVPGSNLPVGPIMIGVTLVLKFDSHRDRDWLFGLWRIVFPDYVGTGGPQELSTGCSTVESEARLSSAAESSTVVIMCVFITAVPVRFREGQMSKSITPTSKNFRCTKAKLKKVWLSCTAHQRSRSLIKLIV